MNRTVLVSVIIAAICFIVIGVAMNFGPDMLSGFEATREATKDYTEIEASVATTTSGDNVSANITLDYPVYLDSTGRVTSISSNITEKQYGPTANTVIATALKVSGLTESSTRTLTIVYDYRMPGYYTAFSTVVEFGPVVILLGFIIVVAIVGFMGIKAIRKKA